MLVSRKKPETKRVDTPCSDSSEEEAPCCSLKKLREELETQRRELERFGQRMETQRQELERFGEELRHFGEELECFGEELERICRRIFPFKRT